MRVVRSGDDILISLKIIRQCRFVTTYQQSLNYQDKKVSVPCFVLFRTQCHRPELKRFVMLYTNKCQATGISNI